MTHALLPIHDVELATAYTIHELRDSDPRAFDKAYSKWAEHQEVYLEPDYVLEMYAEEHLEKQGYDVDTGKGALSWNLGSHNGTDYFAFKAAVDVRQWLKHRKLGNKYRAVINYATLTGWPLYVYIRWNHSSYNGVYVYAETDGYRDLSDKADAQLAALEELILEDAQEHMNNIRKWLFDDYEYQLSEEYFIDACDANEYLFDEDGNIV